MIGWLSGHIVDKSTLGKLVLNVQGVGYDVETSLTTFFQLETVTSAALHIHTIVREDALLLFGFLDKTEREIFRALIKVNGIGPKVAMNVLSSLTPDALIQCVEQGAQDQLTRVPGIGQKTAARLLIDLKDKLSDLIMTSTPSLSPAKNAQSEALAALEALGYKPAEANKLLKAVDDGSHSCEALIRRALQHAAVS